jgi:hypothetical protein
MAVLSDAIRELVSNSPNTTEFMLLSKPINLGADGEIESALKSWALAFGHQLREGGRRNPFNKLDHDGAKSHIVERLSRDIVFKTKGFELEEAAELAETLLAFFGEVAAVEADFAIRDWTFCDLIIATGNEYSFVFASLGED